MKVQIDNQIIRFGSDCIGHGAANKALVKALLTQWAEKISQLAEDDSVYLPLSTFLTEEVGVQIVKSLKSTKKEKKIIFRVVHLGGDIYDDWFTWSNAKLFSDRDVSSGEVVETYSYPQIFGEYDVYNLVDDLLQAEITKL